MKKIRKTLDFIEKPVTPDEVAIAAVIERMAAAILGKNTDLLATVFSDDASIAISESGPLLTKEEFMYKMLEIISDIRSISYKNILIRTKDVTEAIVSCVSSINVSGNYLSRNRYRHFKLVKVKSDWLISQATFMADR